MTTKSGIVLGPLEIANEYGTIHIFKNNLAKGEPIWIYYDGLGRVKNILLQRANPVQVVYFPLRHQLIQFSRALYPMRYI